MKAKKIYNHCKDYLEGNLLDVGAGRCFIAKTIKEKKGIDVTCIDIKDLNRTDLKLILYDGKKLPFKDNQFTTVLLVYVLHHCEDPEQVLKECIRVTKRNIIIFEDPDPNFMTKFMDYIFNTIRGVKATMQFKTIGQWKSLFQELNLELVKVERNVEKQWFYPFIEHVMFVVKKR